MKTSPPNPVAGAREALAGGNLRASLESSATEIRLRIAAGGFPDAGLVSLLAETQGALEALQAEEAEKLAR